MKTKDKLSIGNYLGYTLVDVGNSLAFAAMGSFLTVFYTDVFGISPVVTGIIMIIARIWDGINDPWTPDNVPEEYYRLPAKVSSANKQEK